MIFCQCKFHQTITDARPIRTKSYSCYKVRIRRCSCVNTVNRRRQRHRLLDIYSIRRRLPPSPLFAIWASAKKHVRFGWLSENIERTMLYSRIQSIVIYTKYLDLFLTTYTYNLLYRSRCRDEECVGCELDSFVRKRYIWV